MLERPAESTAGALRRTHSSYVFTVKQYAARCWAHQSRADVERSGLAGTIRANQPSDAARPRRELDARGSGEPAITNADIPDSQLTRISGTRLGPNKRGTL